MNVLHRITTRLALIALVALALVLLAAFSATAVNRPDTVKAEAEVEVSLVARNMAFYLPGDPTPNPTLRVRPGQVLRLRLVNEDLGMEHDWVVDALGVRTRVLVGDGTAQELTVQAPSQPGTHDYTCSLHAQMMRGKLEVR